MRRMAEQRSTQDIPNAQMVAAWDGPEGQSWAANADGYERTTRGHRKVVLEALDLDPTASVLDVGCGAGALTIEAARLAPHGHVLGVDLSSQMLAVARTRAAAAGLDNVVFEQGDAQVQPFTPGAADVAVSCFGAMFFDEPVRAFANIRRALRPGGGAAFLVWRELGANEWVDALRRALAMGRDLPQPPAGAPGPFSLADAGVARDHLEAAGFVEVRTTPVEQPISFGADQESALAFVSTLGLVRGLVADLDDAARHEALESLSRSLAEHTTADGVLYGSAAWLVQATNAS